MSEYLVLPLTALIMVVISAVVWVLVGAFIARDEKQKSTTDMMSLNQIKQVNKEKSEAQLELERAKAILKELDFPSDPVDILKLLEDRPKMEFILHKLKMKAFW